MTTTIKIDAHCGSEQVVHVKVRNDITHRVQYEEYIPDGEGRSYNIYDDLYLLAKEVKKPAKSTQSE